MNFIFFSIIWFWKQYYEHALKFCFEKLWVNLFFLVSHSNLASYLKPSLRRHLILFLNRVWISRSTRSELFCKKGVLKIPVSEPLFNKAVLLKKRLRRRCFSVNFCGIFKSTFFRIPPVVVFEFSASYRFQHWTIFGIKYYRVDQEKFVEDSL